MVENYPQHNINLDKIPEKLSYEAMEAKYDFNLADENHKLG
jgi:hypothetical protein